MITNGSAPTCNQPIIIKSSHHQSCESISETKSASSAWRGNDDGAAEGANEKCVMCEENGRCLAGKTGGFASGGVAQACRACGAADEIVASC